MEGQSPTYGHQEQGETGQPHAVTDLEGGDRRQGKGQRSEVKKRAGFFGKHGNAGI